MKKLSTIFSSIRPFGSKEEKSLANKIAKNYGGLIDRHGNVVIRIEPAQVVFLAHLDTVGKHVSARKVIYQRPFLFVAGGGILGADDGAGIYVLLEMIQRKIPGLYIFCVGEEVGCIGSKGFVADNKDCLKNFKLAISFDRKGTDEVIYCQMGVETAPIDIAQKVCSALNMGHHPSPNGIFTDSFSFFPHLPGINISVGYENAHTNSERLNLHYLRALIKRVFEINWNEIV